MLDPQIVQHMEQVRDARRRAIREEDDAIVAAAIAAAQDGREEPEAIPQRRIRRPPPQLGQGSVLNSRYADPSVLLAYRDGELDVEDPMLNSTHAPGLLRRWYREARPAGAPLRDPIPPVRPRAPPAPLDPNRAREIHRGLSLAERAAEYMDRHTARTNEILRWIQEYENPQDSYGLENAADVGRFNNALSTDYGRAAILIAHQDYRRELSILVGEGNPPNMAPDLVETSLMRISERESRHLAGDREQIDRSQNMTGYGIMELTAYMRRHQELVPPLPLPELGSNQTLNQTAQQIPPEAEAPSYQDNYHNMVAIRLRNRGQRYGAAYDRIEPWPVHPSDEAIARMDAFENPATDFTRPTAREFDEAREFDDEDRPRHGNDWLLRWSERLVYRAFRLHRTAVEATPTPRNPMLDILYPVEQEGREAYEANLRRRPDDNPPEDPEPPQPRRRRIGGHVKNGVTKPKPKTTAKSRPEKETDTPATPSKAVNPIKLPPSGSERAGTTRSGRPYHK